MSLLLLVVVRHGHLLRFLLLQMLLRGEGLQIGRRRLVRHVLLRRHGVQAGLRGGGKVLLRAQRLHADGAGHGRRTGDAAKVLHRAAQRVHADGAGQLLRGGRGAEVLRRAQRVHAGRALHAGRPRQLLLRPDGMQRRRGRRRRLPQLLLLLLRADGMQPGQGGAKVLPRAQRVHGRLPLQLRLHLLRGAGRRLRRCGLLLLLLCRRLLLQQLLLLLHVLLLHLRRLLLLRRHQLLLLLLRLHGLLLRLQECGGRRLVLQLLLLLRGRSGLLRPCRGNFVLRHNVRDVQRAAVVVGEIVGRMHLLRPCDAVVK